MHLLYNFISDHRSIGRCDELAGNRGYVLGFEQVITDGFGSI